MPRVILTVTVETDADPAAVSRDIEQVLRAVSDPMDEAVAPVMEPRWWLVGIDPSGKRG
jgi:hypothetical protein